MTCRGSPGYAMLLKVAGKLLICGDIAGKKYLTCDEKAELLREQFEQYSKGPGGRLRQLQCG